MVSNKQEVSKGLGDTIEKITTATGVKKVVETVAKAVGKDCGCAKRRDALNRAFPYQNNEIKKIG
jgi:predicted transcriptional regulator